MCVCLCVLRAKEIALSVQHFNPQITNHNPAPPIQMYLFPLFSPLLGCTEEVSLPLSLSPPTSLFTPSFCRQQFRSCVPSNVTAPPSGKLPQASRMENAYKERPTLCSQQTQGPPASRSVPLRRQRGNYKSQILFPVTRENVLLYHRHSIISLCTW